MLAILEEIAKRQGLELRIISVCREHWGPGEPNDRPFFTLRPDKAINVLLNDRLSKARKTFYEMGRAEYEPIAKGICSDIRITMEKLVESHLLSDVVQRFRRAVHTQGKIKGLAKIKLEDCIFIDDLMTKYSKFEHSQPNEAPILIPPPEEIDGDLRKLKAWCEEFAGRPAPNV